MYKTVCSKCRKTYQTEVEWYSYICPKCEEEGKKKALASDVATLQKLRRELDEAIASGADQSVIDAKNLLYKHWVEYLKKTYGGNY